MYVARSEWGLKPDVSSALRQKRCQSGRKNVRSSYRKQKILNEMSVAY